MPSTITTKDLGERWRGMATGSITIALFLVAGMAAYRTIDLGVYTGMPEAFRSLVGIPSENADVASIAYGAIYTFYGALALSGFALTAGTAAVAGEERRGTIGLLLGNPRSRTQVVLAKAAAIIALTAGGTLLLWAAGLITPVLLGVDVTGLHIGGLLVHVFAVALFHGLLALAIGSWTGSTAIASGATAGVLALSFFAVGLLPLIDGAEDLARLFPWYYLDASKPVLNGVDWGHVIGLLTAGVVLTGVSVVGAGRRDLRAAAIRVTLLDRLRENPRTQQVIDRLAGSARTSHLWAKTVTEHQVLALVTAAIMFSMMGLMMGPLYLAIEDQLAAMGDSLPEALLALVGGADMSTPAGWYQTETFGLMAPAACMVVAITVGARALAGEESRRTMGLLLANPIRRSTIVKQKASAMVLLTGVVGLATWAGVGGGSLLAGLGLSLSNIGVTSLLAVLFGLVFGSLALLLSAATGRTRVAVAGSAGVGFLAYLVDSLAGLSDGLQGLAAWSPYHYYLSGDPLNDGLDPAHAGVLLALSAVMLGASVWAFQRRDLRTDGG